MGACSACLLRIGFATKPRSPPSPQGTSPPATRSTRSWPPAEQTSASWTGWTQRLNKFNRSLPGFSSLGNRKPEDSSRIRAQHLTLLLRAEERQVHDPIGRISEVVPCEVGPPHHTLGAHIEDQFLQLLPRWCVCRGCPAPEPPPNTFGWPATKPESCPRVAATSQAHRLKARRRSA